MELPLPAAEHQTFSALASAAGYESVESCVADYLSEIAKQHARADLAPLADGEIHASLAVCDERKAQADAGESRVLKRIMASLAALETFPHAGPKAPEDAHRDYTIRFHKVDPCLNLYHARGDAREVRVIGFRHGAPLPRPDEIAE